MKIITISGYAEHGKDTTATILKKELEKLNLKVLIIHYADLVKFICKQYFDWDGNKDEKGRHILQKVGTDIVRAKNPDYWINFVKGFVDLFNDMFDMVLIPDTRFPNEIEIWERDGYQIKSIWVKRKNFENSLTEVQRLHPSEKSLNNFCFDYYITSSSIQELKNIINNLIEELI